MPSRAEVDRIRTANVEIARRVERDLVAFWATLDLEKPEAARDALLRFVPALTTTYGVAAAAVAADWYDEVRASESVGGRFQAVVAAPFPVEFVEQRVRFGARHLFTDAPSQMLPFLSNAVHEYALQPGRETVARSSYADPRAAGWHREARGASTCAFCRLLIGRGGVYRQATASFAAHGHCDCVAVPSWDPDAPEVPASAYVASQRVSEMSPEQHAAHTQRVRDYLAQEG